MTDGVFHNTGIIPEPGEVVVHRGVANHWRGPEAVGGRLWLTTSWLIFRSHALNIQTGVWACNVEDIESVVPVRTMKIVPNGIEVRLYGGETERFVVRKRRAWLEALNAR